MPAGPCIVCGATNYSMSMGGPGICPSCDCGNAPHVGNPGLVTKSLSVPELTALLEGSDALPVGFIVSQQIWDGLVAHSSLAIARSQSFGAVKMIVDPKMGPTNLEAVFSSEMWRKRCREITGADPATAPA